MASIMKAEERALYCFVVFSENYLPHDGSPSGPSMFLYSLWAIFRACVKVLFIGTTGPSWRTEFIAGRPSRLVHGAVQWLTQISLGVWW